MPGRVPGRVPARGVVLADRKKAIASRSRAPRRYRDDGDPLYPSGWLRVCGAVGGHPVSTGRLALIERGIGALYKTIF